MQTENTSAWTELNDVRNAGKSRRHKGWREERQIKKKTIEKKETRFFSFRKLTILNVVYIKKSLSNARATIIVFVCVWAVERNEELDFRSKPPTQTNARQIKSRKSS